MKTKSPNALHALLAPALALVFLAGAAIALKDASFLSQEVGGQIALLAAPLAVMAAGRLHPREALALRRCSWVMPALSLAGIVALHLVLRGASFSLDWILDWLGLGSKEQMDQMDRFERPVREGWEQIPLATVLAIGILPAICEEALFRGVALAGFARSFGTRAALFATAMLFGLFHGITIRIAVTFLLGLYFGYLVLRTGSIWPAMLAHAANNVMALALPEADRPAMDVLIALPAVPVFAAILWLIRRASTRRAAP